MEKKILFLGGGNMAEGIIGGLLKHKVFEPGNITVYDVIPARLEYLKNTYGLQTKDKGIAAAADQDVVFLAVRPQDVDNACRGLDAYLRPDTIVMSIISSTDIAKLESFAGSGAKIARIMPNTLIKTGNGYSAAAVNGNVDEGDKKTITAVLDALGQTMYIREEMFDRFTAYSCAGPMFLYMMAHALIEAGIHSGFSTKESYDIVIKNMIGAGENLELTGSHPLQLIDTMTSPAGVTIESLKVLEEEAFTGIVMKAMEAGVKRAEDMGK